MKRTIFFILFIAAIFFAFFGRSLYTGFIVAPIHIPTPTCDPTLWDHVYNSSRLIITNNCTSVTGTIISSYQVNDGDQHIQLFPDKQYLGLLNKNNIEFQLSSLVIEPVCSHDPSIINNSTLLDAGVGYAEDAINSSLDEDAIEACNGFVSDVYIPKVGEHVRITGSYVLDTWHGWMEIHPVSKIEVLP